MFVIRKSKTPSCYKQIKNLPYKYKSQKKSWVDSQVFEEWVRKLDQKFRLEGGKIALLIDNCPAHPSVFDLTNVQVVFLQPNTTQFYNRWILRSLKIYYQGRVLRQLCRALDKVKTLPKISFLQAMKILVSSWEVVSAQTIANCFRKAGITLEVQNAAITGADDPFSDLKESLQYLSNIDSYLVPGGVTPVSLIDIDNKVIAMALMIADDDILRSLKTFIKFCQVFKF